MMMQAYDIATNSSVMAIVGVIFGFVVAFGLLYLLLERKKRTLAGVLVLAALACGGAYWYSAHKARAALLDAPKTVVTERITVPKAVVPLPVPRPRVKRGCYPLKRRPPVASGQRPL